MNSLTANHPPTKLTLQRKPPVRHRSPQHTKGSRCVTQNSYTDGRDRLLAGWLLCNRNKTLIWILVLSKVKTPVRKSLKTTVIIHLRRDDGNNTSYHSRPYYTQYTPLHRVWVDGQTLKVDDNSRSCSIPTDRPHTIFPHRSSSVPFRFLCHSQPQIQCSLYPL